MSRLHRDGNVDEQTNDHVGPAEKETFGRVTPDAGPNAGFEPLATTTGVDAKGHRPMDSTGPRHPFTVSESIDLRRMGA